MKTTTRFSDKLVSLDKLKKLVFDFVDERKWWCYHAPKNLAISIAIEAAELLEHFQWTDSSEKKIEKSELAAIEDEMADVLAYLLSLANVLNIDISKALRRKMDANAKKYPREKFQGVWNKVRTPEK